MEILRASIYTLLGTSFTFFLTTLGAATIFMIRRKQSKNMQSICMGFAAGIMIASAIWSLLIPGLEFAEKESKIPWLIVSSGFLLGGVIFYFVDMFLTCQYKSKEIEDNNSVIKKLFTVITMHNIPEGMAIGLSFSMALQEGSQKALVAAIALAIGIGVQNLPEGAAVALPIYQNTNSRKKGFLYGALSGAIEPIGGIIAVLFFGIMQKLLAGLLAFAAGAMIYVVVSELIPEMKQENEVNIGTIATLCGFVIMMVLDVTLG